MVELSPCHPARAQPLLAPPVAVAIEVVRVVAADPHRRLPRRAVRRIRHDDRWQLVPLAMHWSMYLWSVAGAHPLLNPP